jgi:hypothetical protein
VTCSLFALLTSRPLPDHAQNALTHNAVSTEMPQFQDATQSCPLCDARPGQEHAPACPRHPSDPMQVRARSVTVSATNTPHPKCVSPDCNCVMKCEAEALPRARPTA